jgi:UDP-N-acetylglucosamine diphosphorylase / glucose-1-phosphate thymidylyltransferase / UDP-N-acetylgalactosamine diphosphorylase / glucosamine-1-phosphate N-acetyltransferase / galactosamine-1-phosphate N-acetyltransferase
MPRWLEGTQEIVFAAAGWCRYTRVMFRSADYLDLARTEHLALFDKVEFVWEALPQIGAYLQFRLRPAVEGKIIGKPPIGERVYIGEGTVVEPGAHIKGPAWIGRNCEIRSGAYIRENVVIGDDCVIGNSSEFKNCILFNGCQVPHFNYVGDSILGAGVHLAAGVILSNQKLHGDAIVIKYLDKSYPTGLQKFGAVIGDHAEIGCNSVLNPGSIIGRRSLIYPGIQWRGVLPEDSIVKTVTTQQIVARRPRE